jgi:acyl carrier protein
VRTRNDYRSFILEYVRPQLSLLGLDPASAPDDLDLLETGLIDSLGVLELAAAIGSEFGIEVDIYEMDPDDLTVVGRLSDFLAGSHQNRFGA